jgi:hypothetical protein
LTFFLLFSDIVSLKNLKPAETNPFFEFARQYSQRVDARLDVVMPQSGQDLENLKFDVTLTLLPHQVFIMPLLYLTRLTNGAAIHAMGIIRQTEHLIR